jgi:pimeloyl-ACP methyl ester carboxylesterase
MIACGALVGALTVSLIGKPAHAGWFTHTETTEKPATKIAVKPATKQHVDAVFLHGLGGSPKGMPLPGLEGELAKLGVALKMEAPWLRPVEIDDEGYARSTGTHTMTDQLARARAEIAKHDGPVVLIGHSFGGKAAIALAKEMPGKVKGVIAIAPSVKMLYAYYKNLTQQKGLPEREAVVARLGEHERWLTGEIAKTDSLAREARDQGDDRRAAGLSGKVRGLRGELDYLKTMQDLALHDETNMELNVGVPVLMLHGTDDHAVSIHYARRFAEANPKVKLVEYEGIGHGMDSEDRRLERDARKDMVGQIHGFLKELEAK